MRFGFLDTKAARVWLCVAVALLIAMGLVMVFSATSASLVSDGKNTYDDVISQIAYIFIGFACLLAILFMVPVHSLIGLPMMVYYAFCMALLVLTCFAGTEVNGAKRWLYIGPIGFQPSEFVKIAFLLMTIRIIYNHQTKKTTSQYSVIEFIVFIVVPLFFMYATQSDLGTVAICIVGIFAAFWISGAVNKRILIPIALIVVVAILIAIFGVGYRSDRLVYLDPWNDGQGGLGAGYNIIHSYYAIAEGGLFGVGIGASHEKYDYLFAADSDFVFAIICEELGFVGALFVIALFLIVLFSGFGISATSSSNLGRILAGTFVTMLVFQAFLNIGCTIGVFPTTGKPLPFISSGGSSVISSLMIVGIVLSVAKESIDNSNPRRQRDNIRVISNDRSR